MALKEHENNIITKDHKDPITVYLMNIIQRYFQIENEISQESKEAIIIQAYTRLKEILNAYTSQYIICINERSGNIDLFIRDFGGEEAFDKNTAFNKDFCDVTTETKTLWNGTNEDYYNFGEDQVDHIVAGDDDRLSDARVPLMHVHTIDDVIGLRERLEEYNLINGGFHLHNNQTVLNMLIYTGSRTSIDLLLIEDLVSKVEKAVERFKETDEYFTTIGQHYINQLQDIFTPIYNKLRYIDENIDSWIVNWLQDSKIYTDIQNISFKNYIKTILKDYLSLEEYNILKDTLEHSIRIIDSGNIPVSNDIVSYSINSINTDKYTGYYGPNKFDIKKGYTNVRSDYQSSKKVTGSVLNKFYNNDINNGGINVFFEYTKDGVHYRDLLPHTYQITDDSTHDFINVDYNTDSDNNINVEFTRISYFPVYLYYPITLFAWVEDNAGHKSSAILQIDSDDNANVTNGVTQSTNVLHTDDSTTINFKIIRSCIPFATERIRDLTTITAEYGAGGLSPGAYGARKELLTFTAREDYNGTFYLEMNTGHWYGFEIQESTDGINFTKIKDNYADSNATHVASPLALPMSDVTFVNGRSYKIITQECAGGGTSAEYFIYTFDADDNFAVSIMQDCEINVDATFSVHKNNNVGELSWTITKHFEEVDKLIGDDPPFVYNIIKNLDTSSLINCNHNTSYDDTLIDTLDPNIPTITGRCISSNNTIEQYEFTINASDLDEKTYYKLQICTDPSDTLNDGASWETDTISISSYSDIKKIHFTTRMNSFTDFINDSMYTLISDEDVSIYQKKIKINKKKNAILDNKIIFCDNTYEHANKHNDIIDFLSPFHCKLANLNANTTKQYCSSIILLQNIIHGDFKYHVDGSSATYFDGNNKFTSDDSINNYFGEYTLAPLNDLFNNATISYQLFIVPGKGEDDA